MPRLCAKGKMRCNHRHVGATARELGKKGWIVMALYAQEVEAGRRLADDEAGQAHATDPYRRRVTSRVALQPTSRS